MHSDKNANAVSKMTFYQQNASRKIALVKCRFLSRATAIFNIELLKEMMSGKDTTHTFIHILHIHILEINESTTQKK